MIGRRLYLEQHTFELLIAVLSIIAAVSFALDPGTLRQTAIGRQLVGWDVAWNLCYGISGVLIVVGLVAIRPRVEALGLIMLCAAVAIYAIAVCRVAGSIGASAIAAYVAIALACAGRVTSMFRVSKGG